MTAYLYLTGESFMAFECGQVFFKFLVPSKLTSINKIKTYDNGYLVMDTNYGEEYIDLNSIADEINLQVCFNNLKPMLGRS